MEVGRFGMFSFGVLQNPQRILSVSSTEIQTWNSCLLIWLIVLVSPLTWGNECKMSWLNDGVKAKEYDNICLKRLVYLFKTFFCHWKLLREPRIWKRGHLITLLNILFRSQRDLIKLPCCVSLASNKQDSDVSFSHSHYWTRHSQLFLHLLSCPRCICLLKICQTPYRSC